MSVCSKQVQAILRDLVSNVCQLNEAGDDASGANTTGDATLCVSTSPATAQSYFDWHCERGVAGDDASGAATTCGSTLCVEDQYVSGNVCLSCPDGTVNVAGGDNSGADATCDTTFRAAVRHRTFELPGWLGERG